MTALMQPLRDEHAHLLPHVDELLALAEAVGDAPLPDLRERAEAARAFLAGHLLPHAAAEDRVLYPVADALLGTDGATATMRLEHVEIARRIEELAALVARLGDADVLDVELAAALRRTLYGLHALLRMHFAEEEDWLVPVLEVGLTPGEADQLFATMHDAARTAAPT